MARPALDPARLRRALRALAAGLGTLALAGCMDVEAEVTVLDMASARVTTEATMSEDVFALLAAQATGTADLAALCDGQTPTIEAGTVTCVSVSEGPFARFPLDDGGDPVFTIRPLAGTPQRVRVELSTPALTRELVRRAGGAAEVRTNPLTGALLAGHSFTFSVSGGPIRSTNMERDGSGAGLTLALDRLLAGDPDMPERLYAVVDISGDGL